VARSSSYSAPALEKGLDIVELLSTEEDGLAQNEIAQRLSRSVGQIFRMLEVLERRGYIRRSDRDGRYRLTLKLFELGHRHPPVRRLLNVALPEMRRLTDTTAQSVHLSVHHDRRLLVVAQIDGFRSMGFSVRLGAHFPFRPDRVSARVITAFQDAERRARFMRELAAGLSPKEKLALERTIAKIAREGYVSAPSDTVTGVVDICHPIFDASGIAVAAMTVPYVRMRDNPTPLDETRRVASDVTSVISARLGYLP
jgi:DNA-binding IclR family transcriptional regulator